MITLFKHGQNISLHRKLIKNSQKLFYIFAVWEYWSENQRQNLKEYKTSNIIITCKMLRVDLVEKQQSLNIYNQKNQIYLILLYFYLYYIIYCF